MKTGFASFRFLRRATASVAAIFAFVAIAPAAEACFSDYVEGQGTDSPSIILVNSCNTKIYYNLCTLKAGEFRNHFPGYTAPGGRSRHTLWLKKGQGFTFRYNYSPHNYPAPVNC